MREKNLRRVSSSFASTHILFRTEYVKYHLYPARASDPDSSFCCIRVIEWSPKWAPKWWQIYCYYYYSPFYRALHHVHLSHMRSKQAFHSINLSSFGFLIISQSVWIFISFGRSSSLSNVFKLFWSLKIALTHAPLRASIEIAWIGRSLQGHHLAESWTFKDQTMKKSNNQ